MERTQKEVIELQTWWMNVLRRVTQNVMDEEEKRQDRINRKNEKLLGEFQTMTDIMDAYGCGAITERKKDKLIDLMEQRTAKPEKLYEMKMQLLTEMYQTAKQIIEDNK